jgi:hypothetical protein
MSPWPFLYLETPTMPDDDRIHQLAVRIANLVDGDQLVSTLREASVRFPHIADKLRPIISERAVDLTKQVLDAEEQERNLPTPPSPKTSRYTVQAAGNGFCVLDMMQLPGSRQIGNPFHTEADAQDEAFHLSKEAGL